jgi:hypothetical protein
VLKGTCEDESQNGILGSRSARSLIGRENDILEADVSILISRGREGGREGTTSGLPSTRSASAELAPRRRDFHKHSME